jgi:hypothetical protein
MPIPLAPSAPLILDEPGEHRGISHLVPGFDAERLLP